MAHAKKWVRAGLEFERAMPCSDDDRIFAFCMERAMWCASLLEEWQVMVRDYDMSTPESAARYLRECEGIKDTLNWIPKVVLGRATCRKDVDFAALGPVLAFTHDALLLILEQEKVALLTLVSDVGRDRGSGDGGSGERG